MVANPFKKSTWVLEKEESSIAPDNVWSNKDLDPSPPEHRTWSSWTFAAYWISDLVYPNSWATVSAFVTLGLTWWESCLAVLVGSALVAVVITANGIIGATTHTPFAVTCRTTFGYWGSKFVVFSRCVIACFWLSINSWSGGQFVTLMIGAIWPSYFRLKNQVPESQGATTSDFISFFIFWLIQLPFIFIHPSKLKPVFNIKAAVVPVVAIGTLIWAVKIAGPDAGHLLRSGRNRVQSGVPRFVAFMTAVTAVEGTWATLSLNIGDFSRYCRSPKSNWIQIWAFPVINTIVSICAAISATCAYAVYNEDLYQPYDILAKWNTSPGGRAAMFLGALAWALSNVTTNITANSISAANDMCSLAPKYMDIKRGQLFAITIGVWGFVPWKVMNSAANFLAFMASYSIVLAPIAMLMVVDFFIVKGRKYDIYEMYRPTGIYRYSPGWQWKGLTWFGGWNWRAYVALACAVAPNLPGMVHSINNAINIGNIKYVYMVSNLVAYTIAVPIYLLLNYLWPAPEAIVDEPVHDIIPGLGKRDSEETVGAALGAPVSAFASATGEKVDPIDKEEA